MRNVWRVIGTAGVYPLFLLGFLVGLVVVAALLVSAAIVEGFTAARRLAK